jgi:hypothetical protein
MIKGVERKAVPYVLEEDRGSSSSEQTIFWIKPKRSAEANKTLARYGATSRDGRGGYKEFDAKKLDAADIDEFCSLVEKVENYGLPNDSDLISAYKDGIIKETVDKLELSEVARTMSSAHLTEIFDAAGNSRILEEGRFKGEKSINLVEKLETK